MKKKSILALTLGLGLAVGSLTMGAYSVIQAHERPAGMGHMQMNHEKPMYDKENHQEMLNLLQIDEQTFKQEKDSGKSLTEIAALHHVSRQTVIDLVVKHMNQHIDKGLAEGRISAEQANQMKTNAADKAQKMVDGQQMGFDKKHGPRKCGNEQPMNGKPMHNSLNQQEMLTLLQIDEQTFKQEADSGKSLTEIGLAHNVPRQDIIDLIARNMNQHNEKGLADQRISVEQANEMKAHAAEKVQNMVDGPIIGHHAKHQR